MNSIKQDKYILGQSQSKEIEDSSQEIRLDLILEPNINPLGGEIFGIVMDEHSNPIPDALIKIMSDTYDPLMHTLTNSKGEYSFINVPPSNLYNIFAIAKGTKLSNGNSFSIEESGFSNINFTLIQDPSMEDGIIAGDLISSTNSPIFGAVVSLYKKNIDSSETLLAIIYTNEYGQFVFREVKVGLYVININALGYTSFSTNISVTEPGEIVPIDISIVENSLSSNGTVSGVIEDTYNNPINRADVILYNVKQDNSLVPIAFTKTNPKGLYLFTNVPKGFYKIKANEIEFKTIEIEISETTSPYFAGFSIRSIEKYINSEYTMEKATLSNNTTLKDNNIFVEHIGGKHNGSATLTVNVPTDGEYNLILDYIPYDTETSIKLSVNGIIFPKIYKLAKANSSENSEPHKLNTTVILNTGDNTIKFFNDTGDISPSIGNITLSPITKVLNNYKLEDVNLFGSAKLENNLIKNVGPGLGYITLKAHVPNYGYYNFIINYVSENIYKDFKICINNINIEKSLIFHKTSSLDIFSIKDNIIPIKLNKGVNTIKIYKS